MFSSPPPSCYGTLCDIFEFMLRMAAQSLNSRRDSILCSRVTRVTTRLCENDGPAPPRLESSQLQPRCRLCVDLGLSLLVTQASKVSLHQQVVKPLCCCPSSLVERVSNLLLLAGATPGRITGTFSFFGHHECRLQSLGSMRGYTRHRWRFRTIQADLRLTLFSAPRNRASKFSQHQHVITSSMSLSVADLFVNSQSIG